MDNPKIHHYLQILQRELWIRGIADRETIAEINSHLIDAAEHLRLVGVDSDEAEKQAILNFGRADKIANQFMVERLKSMQTLFLLIAAALGGVIAYIDSRPTWDDTGITVLALLVVSGLMGLVSPKRPWKWALAVGIWLPLIEIYLTHNYSMLVVLVFPLIGSYAGAGLNWIARKSLNSA